MVPPLLLNILYPVYCDAELLTRILSQDWVEPWEGWFQVLRQFLDMGEACSDSVAEDCADRFTKIPIANSNADCKSDGERKEYLLVQG